MAKHINVHISTSLSEDEWKVLRSFCEKAKRLATTKLISNGNASIRGKIRYEQNMGLWFESQMPPEEEITEFLVAFRFFYLQKEATHFPKILGLIGKHTNDLDARKALKLFGKQWKDNLFGKALNIKLNDISITSSLLIDLWLNAHYFHSDDKKEQELKRLKDFFSENFAKYMLLDATFEASKIVFKVFDGLQKIVDDHFKS